MKIDVDVSDMHCDKLNKPGRGRLKAVLFDLYSTIVEEVPDNPFYEFVSSRLKVDHAQWHAAYKSYGYATMRGELLTMADRVHAACRQIGSGHDRDEVSSIVEVAMGFFYDSVRLYPESLSVLGRVRDMGLETCLISNASSYSETVLDNHNLRPLFDHLVLSYEVKSMKPDPVIYKHGLDLLNRTADECIFVGDGGDSEMSGARAVGLRTILVDRHKRNVDADHVVEDLIGIIPIISQFA